MIHVADPRCSSCCTRMVRTLKNSQINFVLFYIQVKNYWRNKKCWTNFDQIHAQINSQCSKSTSSIRSYEFLRFPSVTFSPRCVLVEPKSGTLCCVQPRDSGWLGRSTGCPGPCIIISHTHPHLHSQPHKERSKFCVVIAIAGVDFRAEVAVFQRH